MIYLVYLNQYPCFLLAEDGDQRLASWNSTDLQFGRLFAVYLEESQEKAADENCSVTRNLGSIARINRSSPCSLGPICL